MLQREYSSLKSSSSMLLGSGFARTRLGSPSGIYCEDAGARGGCSLSGRSPARSSPNLSHHNPTPNPLPGFPSPLACADNTPSVPHLKGALSGGMQMPWIPFSRAGCVAAVRDRGHARRGGGGVAHVSQELGVHCGACSASLRPRGSSSAPPTPPLSRGVRPRKRLA